MPKASRPSGVGRRAAWGFLFGVVISLVTPETRAGLAAGGDRTIQGIIGLLITGLMVAAAFGFIQAVVNAIRGRGRR